MKIAVLADIHANLEALEAVLITAANEKVDRILCLGDIVGYGPDPLACIYRLKEVGAQIILGNHDQAVIDPTYIQSFNQLARPSLYHACEVLEESEVNYLRQAAYRWVEYDAVFAHANPLKPEEWEPLYMYEKIAWCMDRLDWSLSFVGHTHEAAIFCKMNGKPVSLTSPTVAIGPHLYLINVGSVGQPRDGDWRASFALWDTEKHCVELQRVEYPVKITQRKIAELDYPNYLSERLSQGE